MAIVVDRVVGGIRDNGAVAQSQGEEDLSGCLTPHLHVPPDFHLRNNDVAPVTWIESRHYKDINK